MPVRESVLLTLAVINFRSENGPVKSWVSSAVFTMTVQGEENKPCEQGSGWPSPGPFFLTHAFASRAVSCHRKGFFLRPKASFTTLK